jgi:hypothetical protein
MVGCLLVAGGCTNQPRTDQELIASAQETVNRKLGVQGTYSLMEAVVAKRIACGHVASPGNSGQDFVYRNDKLILDNDPDFDSAAIECDAAVSGLGGAVADNSGD